MKNVIFDLDLTLVDTSVLEPFRHRRDWQGAYSNIPRCTLYTGVSEVFDFIRDNALKCCIVSTSPRPYVEKIVKYFNIPADYIVGYHDARPTKPSPVPMLKALQLIGCGADHAISFGDRVIDIQSSRSAGIEAIACTWGTKEITALKDCAPDGVIATPTEIIVTLRKA